MSKVDKYPGLLTILAPKTRTDIYANSIDLDDTAVSSGFTLFELDFDFEWNPYSQ